MKLDGISTKNFNVEISKTLWVLNGLPLKIVAETSQTGKTENMLKKSILMKTPFRNSQKQLSFLYEPINFKEVIIPATCTKEDRQRIVKDRRGNIVHIY